MDYALDYANGFFAAAYGTGCARLLAPIDAARPQGDALRGTPEWQAISRARESDDASLPQGVWVRQLKRAAWNDVASATLDALAHRSKDLQLSIWLAQALLHEHGFAGFAAGVTIIDALCERYWDVLYPTIIGGDLEHRSNLFRWLNEKLAAPVRLVPLTFAANTVSTGGVTRQYTWSDCEQLRRQQQPAFAAGVKGDPDNTGGVDAGDFARALESTPDDALLGTVSGLGQAIGGLTKLGRTLDVCFEGDAPGVGMLRGQLEQIHAFLAAELMQRGVSLVPEKGDQVDSDTTHTDIAGVMSTTLVAGSATSLDTLTTTIAAAEAALVDDPYAYADSSRQAASVNPRTLAYAQLADAAAALAELEPHSPVPYLIRKAVEWGTLNTAQLYNELFIQGRGQLNVFELLGLGAPQTVDDTV
jgi:type VI secretion system protein ImpA